MGKHKKEAVRKERQGKTGDGMANVKTKGENFYRDANKVKRLNILKDGKAQRNAAGKITKAASFQSRDKPVARIEPNRKWFGNTRVIAQDALAKFRDAVAQQQSDPYSYLLKQNKLPMSLIRDGEETETKNGIKVHKAKIAVETAPFEDTFGPKSRRKRVKLDVSSLEDLAGKSGDMLDEYKEKRAQDQYLSGAGDKAEAAGELDFEAAVQEADGSIATAREAIFSKGQSKRIWNELYKVVDSSDVLIQVLDARDPEGTRCQHIEKYIKTEAPHKHILLVLNKCDLVPTKIAAQWVRTLSKEYPTLAFHSSITNSFGKGSLIQLLRQFSTLHSHRRQISVGFIGYPNVGKSSIINTLRKKKVCKTAPIPGETKVWQYITLMKRIYLIDCPGIVPPSPTDSDADILLRGVVRVENVAHPAQYVSAALAKCRRRHVERTYGLADWQDADELLEKLARKSGKLLRGGEADLDTVAKTFLQDFLRGRIPWFVPPATLAPAAGDDGASGAAAAVKEGAASSTVDADDEAPGTLGDMTRLNKISTQELRRRKHIPDDAEAMDVDDEQDDDDDDESESDGSSASNDFEDFSDDDDDDRMIGSRSVTATEATDDVGVALISSDDEREKAGLDG